MKVMWGKSPPRYIHTRMPPNIEHCDFQLKLEKKEKRYKKIVNIVPIING
jgi:hypothetical protein